jgi:hypothetical protein
MFDSSIMDAPALYRLVWFYMLMACDKNGNVYGTTSALSRRFNLPEEKLVEALSFLEQEDPNSTTVDPEYGGRRIVDLGNNLRFVVNYLFYRGLRDPDEERQKTRDRVRKHRQKKSASNAGNKNVTENNDKAEAEAEAYTSSPSDQPMDDGFDLFWEKYPRKEAKKKTQAAWRNLTKKDQAAVMEDLPKYSEFVAGKEKQFVLLPTSYLNGRRWEDDRESPAKSLDFIVKLARSLGCNEDHVRNFWACNSRTPTSKEEVDEFTSQLPF